MYVRSDVKPSLILWFCWRHLLFFTIYGLVIYIAFHKLNWRFIAIPFLPVGTIGTAVAFYVGFKNNASYERLWEGRKVWGAIANLCRAVGSLVMALPNQDSEFKKRFLRQQIAWCNLLRVQLRGALARRKTDTVPPEVAFLERALQGKHRNETPAEVINHYLGQSIDSTIGGAPNPAYRLLALQTSEISAITATDPTTEHLVEKILDNLVECTKEQGSAERLKEFPFPRQYAYFSGAFVWIFLLLLPFGLLDELAKGASNNLDWMVIPFNTLISWMFITMEQVGDSSEDPFEMALNDVPLTAICRDIEIELLHISGETNLPEPIQPVADILI